MDNASYHTQKDPENTPMSNWTKPKLLKYLENKNVPIPKKALRKELWVLARQKAAEEPRFKVDDLVKEYGHEVLRLPPYHCDLNPIERI